VQGLPQRGRQQPVLGQLAVALGELAGAGGSAELLRQRRADPVAQLRAPRLGSRLERPGDEAPGQLGVARFFRRDALEHGAHLRVGAVLERFGRLDRGHRFADAALAQRAQHDVSQLGGFESARHCQRARAELARRVAARQTEAVLRVAELVAHGLAGARNELGGRSQAQQLQREAGEGGDRSVFHQRLLGPAARQLGAQLGREWRWRALVF